MRTRPAPREDEVQAAVAALARVLAGSPLVDFAFGHGSFFERLPHHDIDVAVQIPDGVSASRRALSDLATRCEEVVGPGVDLHPLNGTPPGFRKAATSGTLLWARDPEDALQYAELLQRMAWDWRPLQEQIIRDLAP